MTIEGISELEKAEREFDRAKKDYNDLESRVLDHMYGRVPHDPNGFAELIKELREADERVIEAILSVYFERQQIIPASA